MRNNLKSLYELQEIDLRIDGLDGEKGALLAQITALEARLDDVRAKVSLRRADADQLESDKSGLEANLAQESENIARSESHLKEIKTQKEYQAVSKEISTAKKLIAELEDQILQKISKLEELTADIAVETTDLMELESNTRLKQADVRSKVECLEAGMKDDAIARELALKGLPTSVMKRYAKLRDQRKGLAVVEAKDGNCMGCNMHLPPQLYNLLFRADEVITCPHCQRILVMRLEVQGA